MLDIAVKVLERIIHWRIEEVSEKHLSDKQNGFCKYRSTLDVIDLIIRLAKDANSSG